MLVPAKKIFIRESDLADDDRDEIVSFQKRSDEEAGYDLTNLILMGFYASVRKYFEQNREDVNLRISYRTPLHMALQFPFDKMANMLLDLGADVNAEDLCGETAIIAACSVENHEKILQRLIASGAKDIVGGIKEAVRRGFTEYLDILLPLVPNVNNLIDRNGNPVDLLSLSSRKYMTSYLIAHGVRKREIVLDMGTTGLSPENGDKLIAIGAIELIDGRRIGKTFYAEINPLRSVPQDIARIYGLTDEKLKDKPTFPLIAPSFLNFIGEMPLVIQTAPFDMAFLNAELTAAGFAPIDEDRIVNTLPIFPSSIRTFYTEYSKYLRKDDPYLARDYRRKRMYFYGKENSTTV